MASEKVDKIVRELVEVLQSEYSDFRRAYLFGSHARDEAGEDSDIDLALVFDRETDWKFKDEVSEIVWKSMIYGDWVGDVLVFGAKELVSPIAPLRRNIVSEGVVYEKR